MKRMLLALISLNLGLAVFLGYTFVKRPAPSSPSPSVQTTSVPPGKPTRRPIKSSLRPASRSPERKFDWRSIESEDLQQYMGNLRAIGCPEETLRDIIIAEVNRRYASQESALRVRPEDHQPWEAVAAYDKRNNESKLRQLLVEKRDLIKGLVGTEVPIETPPTLAGRNIEKFEAAYRDVPESKREAVRETQERYWSKSDEIKSRTMGFLEPEDREHYAQIKDERRAEMAKVLTTQELEDYEIKTSATAAAMRNRMDGFKATDEEFRAMFKLTQPLDEQYSLISGTRDPEDKAAAVKRTEVEQQLQEAIRNAIGDERYAEMERSRDPVYRNITQAAQQAGLPPEMALQAYDTQKQFRDEINRVAQDPNLSNEQRKQTAAAMQAEAERTLQGILGQKGYEAFQLANPKNSGNQVRQRLQTIVPPGGKP